MDMPSIASPLSLPAAAMPRVAPLGELQARMTCRCEGCGSPVAFDALIVSCSCADEERAADSTLH